MADKQWCFGKMDLWVTNDCTTCKDKTECWNKSFEYMRVEPLSKEEAEMVKSYDRQT